MLILIVSCISIKQLKTSRHLTVRLGLFLEASWLASPSRLPPGPLIVGLVVGVLFATTATPLFNLSLLKPEPGSHPAFRKHVSSDPSSSSKAFALCPA